MKNSELLRELEQHFMKQDKEIVCKILAASMIDMHRMNQLYRLGPNERKSLYQRMAHLSTELIDFIEGKREPLRYTVVSSEE
jgi:hypothetical protein